MTEHQWRKLFRHARAEQLDGVVAIRGSYDLRIDGTRVSESRRVYFCKLGLRFARTEKGRHLIRTVLNYVEENKVFK